MFEAERIADGNRKLANLQSTGVAEHDVWHNTDADPQHRKIGIRVVSHQIGGKPFTLAGRNHDLFGLMDHVAVGQQQAVRGEKETGASAPPRALARVVTCLQVYHRRRCQACGARDGVRIGIQ